MSGMTGVAQTAEVALSAATAKTVIQLVAASNRMVKVTGWGVSFDGTSATAEPAQVEVMRQTSAGTMSALTPVKVGAFSDTLQTTAQHTATVEPTASDVLDSMEVHPQAGYEKVLPPDQYIWMAGGTRLGIKITAPAGVNCRCKIFFEE